VHDADAAFAELFRFENPIRAVAMTTTATETMKMRRPTTTRPLIGLYPPPRRMTPQLRDVHCGKCDPDGRTGVSPVSIDVPSDIGRAALVLQEFIDVPSDIGEIHQSRASSGARLRRQWEYPNAQFAKLPFVSLGRPCNDATTESRPTGRRRSVVPSARHGRRAGRMTVRRPRGGILSRPPIWGVVGGHASEQGFKLP
jgi:hypothetical protein